MKTILTYIYMAFFHPILFLKYTIRKKSSAFLVHGSSRLIKIKHLNVKNSVRMGTHCRINFFSSGILNIGSKCYITNFDSFLVGEDITIGNNVSIASFVLICSENHILNPESRDPFSELDCKPVTIGNYCWIGEKAVILPGVSIGDYSIVGAGSVVTKSIPPYSLAVGNPARVVKKYNLDTHNWENIK